MEKLRIFAFITKRSGVIWFVACCYIMFGLHYSAKAQKINVSPSATVSGSNCSTGPCSAFNDLQYGTCGTQSVWVSTSTPPSSTPGVDWIQWDWPTLENFDEITIHHAQDNARFLTGGLIQTWNGTAWVDHYTFSNLPMQCINTLTFPVAITTRMRITAFQMTGTGQLSNPNFREIEVWRMLGELDDTGVDTLLSPLGDYCAGVQPVSIRVTNFGRNQVDSVEVYWTLNGVPQPSISITTPIDSVISPNNWTEIPLGEFHIPYGVNTEVKAWTHMPNSVVDSFNDNDTLLAIFSAPREGIIFPPMVDTTICEGDTVLFNPQGLQSNVYYAWSHGHVGSDAPISQAGTYWFWVYNDDACESSDTFTVSMESLPTAVAVTGNNVNDKNFLFNLIGAENADIVNWDFGDGSTQTGPGPFPHEYQTDGAYTVKVTLSNYCGEIELSLEVAAGNVGLSDLDLLARQILLYPNPAQDIVTVENKSEARMNGLKVYDVLGKLVFDSGSFDGTKVSLDLSAFSSGVYQLRISTTEGEVRKQLQVLK